MTETAENRRGIFGHVRKEFDEAPLAFSMHVIGTLAVIYEIASSLIHGDARIEGKVQAPVIDFLGLDTVIKVCALLFIQFILAKGQVFVQSRVDPIPTTRSVALVVGAGFVAAWLTVVNVHWMFFSQTIDWMQVDGQAASILLGMIVGASQPSCIS